MSEDKIEKTDEENKEITYFSKVYFIYDDESRDIKKEIESNDFGVKIVSLHVEKFIEKIDSLGEEIDHIVISLSQENISDFLELAYR